MLIPQRRTEPPGPGPPGSDIRELRPPLPPNQVYYSEIAVGVWRGQFQFRILDFTRFFLEGPSLDKAFGLVLHAVCRATDQVFIDSAFRCPPGSEVARALARVSLKLGLPLPDVGVYELNVKYRLDQDGVHASGVLEENLGPIPRRPVTSQVSAEIAERGFEARYRRQGFGTEWHGTYRVAPCRNRVSVTYQSSWGQIHYETRRVQGPPVGGGRPKDDDPEVAGAVDRLRTLSTSLARAAIALDESALELFFIDTYMSATQALIDALRFGVSVPSTRSYDREIRHFARPEWVGELAERFGRRFLDALERRRSMGRAVPGWETVFQALDRQAMTGLDALALCTYAHISFDLPYALAYSAPQGLDLHIEDYELVNRVLAAHVDTLQAEIAGRRGTQYAWLDALAGHYDEVFAGQRIHEARARAWYFATRLRAAINAGDMDRLEEVQRFLVRAVDFFVDSLLAPRPAPLAVAARLSRSLLARVRRKSPAGEFK